MPPRIRITSLSKSILLPRNGLRAPIRLPVQSRRFTPAAAVSGYGDPGQTGLDKGNPKANDPMDETEKREHPGPEPVKEGQNSSTSSGKSSGGDSAGSSGSKSSSGGEPEPKINAPENPSGKGNPEVEQHNKEMDQRYGKDKEGKDQKVEKDYWSGKWELIPPSSSGIGVDGGSVIN